MKRCYLNERAGSFMVYYVVDSLRRWHPRMGEYLTNVFRTKTRLRRRMGE
jgi:hypothetical protein